MLKSTVSKRRQNKRELNRIKLKKVLQTSFGAWKDKDYPDIAKIGTEGFVRKLRKSSR